MQQLWGWEGVPSGGVVFRELVARRIGSFLVKSGVGSSVCKIESWHRLVQIGGWKLFLRGLVEGFGR